MGAATPDKPIPGVGITGVTTVKARFAGLPQAGNVVGRATAPVRVAVYADLACPSCASASRTMVRRIIRKYVRSGRAALVLRPMAFVSRSSMAGALGAEAAARQNAIWPFASLLLANQGPESENWLSDALMEEAARRLGLDVERWRADYASDAVVDAYFRADRHARADRVGGVPTFVLRGPRGRVEVVGDSGIQVFAKAFAEVAPRPAHAARPRPAG
jgi:protein-disulfide isomerase